MANLHESESKPLKGEQQQGMFEGRRKMRQTLMQDSEMVSINVLQHDHSGSM